MTWATHSRVWTLRLREAWEALGIPRASAQEDHVRSKSHKSSQSASTSDAWHLQTRRISHSISRRYALRHQASFFKARFVHNMRFWFIDGVSGAAHVSHVRSQKSWPLQPWRNQNHSKHFKTKSWAEKGFRYNKFCNWHRPNSWPATSTLDMASTILVDRWQRPCNHVQDASRVPADFCGLVSKEERTTDLLDLDMADKSLSLRAPNGCPNLEEDEKVRSARQGIRWGNAAEICRDTCASQPSSGIPGDHWWLMINVILFDTWFLFHFVFLWIYSDH